MDRFRDQGLRAILGQKKLNLILDLDNTLLHAKIVRNLTLDDKRRIKKDDSCELHEVELQGVKLLVKLRPGVREFLKKASDMFELSIYTMGTRDYANTMAGLLALGSNQDGRSMFKKKIISREDCTMARQKGLDVVLSDRRVVLIVDDKDDVWEESCRANVIKIAPYRFFEDGKRKREVDYNEIIAMDDDDELKRVLSTLSMVHHMFYEDNNGDGEYMKRDVRRVLERVCDHEEEKKKDEEGLVRRKRLEEAKARRFIERIKVANMIDDTLVFDCNY
ncbi:RNA polymerase II C-terminal domain phosphatase-like 4 [Silene latifolia]|uniref:RNA polymerase II C-terminal domain phosphatase-like 4 n=1 Tax=Silene latifolia TaxID=37657 RepID=UPI003D76EE4E